MVWFFLVIRRGIVFHQPQCRIQLHEGQEQSQFQDFNPFGQNPLS